MDRTESKELAILLDSLLSKYNRETRHLEFKSNYQDANTLGEYISSLSNGAALDNEDYGYLVFGVDDSSLEINQKKNMIDHLLRGLREEGQIFLTEDKNWELV